jgi:hypothetical protein
LNGIRAAKITVVMLLTCSLLTVCGFAGILFPAQVSGASADIPIDGYKVTLLPEKMPLMLYHGSATWDGTYAYIFGGWNNLHASGVIVKFDPETNSATALLDNLPSPRWDTAAVYAEGSVFNLNNVSYIFGGSGVWYDTSGEVVRFFGDDNWYDVHYWPNGGLSPGGMGMSAIWNGKAVYLFGGKTSSESIEEAYSDDVLEYTLLGSSVVVAKLPHAMAGSSAIWDGTNAYIFGGMYVDNSSQIHYSDEIVRFNPDTNEVVTMNATLPTARALTSAVWDGRYAYVFGGQSNGTDLDEILRYDPSTDILQVLPVKLPFNSEASMAVWNGSAAYIFGGGDVFEGSNPGDGIVVLSTIPKSTASQQLNPALIYVPPIAVVLAVSSLYVFVRRRKHRLVASPTSSP